MGESARLECWRAGWLWRDSTSTSEAPRPSKVKSSDEEAWTGFYFILYVGKVPRSYRTYHQNSQPWARDCPLTGGQCVA